MKSRMLLFLVLATLGALASPAGAEPYWVAYEGNDLPENDGWTRYWGNNDGEYQGGGAIRTIEDGALTMDSRPDPWLYDFNFIEPNWSLDPDPGETFVMEWRLLVDEETGDYGDPLINYASDNLMKAGFVFREDSIWSYYEELNTIIPIVPGVYHDYRFESSDMTTFALYIDDDLAHEGTLWEGLGEPRVGWGSNVRPATSLAHWDYVRFGVIPEPDAVLLVVMAIAFLRRELIVY